MNRITGMKCPAGHNVHRRPSGRIVCRKCGRSYADALLMDEDAFRVQHRDTAGVSTLQYKAIYGRGWRSGYRAGSEGVEAPTSTIRLRLGLSCREECSVGDQTCVCDQRIRRALG